jgi:hypothetical protein
MVTNYLADIEQMLDEQNWQGAVRESLDLPRIAVALADPELHSSDDRIEKWCADWVRPLKTDGDARSSDQERLCQELLARVDARGAQDGVPASALRRLRMRRLARTPPSGFSNERLRADDAEGKEAVDVCTTVVDAVRRWYSFDASRDPVVQANLGKLAILR